MKRLWINDNASQYNKGIIVNFSPTQIITLGFMLLILAGALLLDMPIASRDGKSIGFTDALFTATSAVCVAGLVVHDTYTQWSGFGQIVIMALIQIGGLGIMALATFFSLLLGRKIGLKERLLIQESISEYSLSGIVRVLKKILIVTLVIETIGAVFLSIAFVPVFGLEDGIKKGIFHSVSSFCNAGFDLMGDFKSMTGFQENPLAVLTISVLILIGGLGFIVWRDIEKNRSFKKLSLHTKVVFAAITILTVSGTILFFIFENNNPETIGNMPFHFKIMNSFFQTITSEAAGYNAIPEGLLTDPSKFLTIILMFIGTGPGSTAGGVKVTTVSIIIFTLLSVAKGDEEVNIANRRIPEHIIKKSLVIIVLSLVLVSIVTMVLLMIEKKPFIDTMFEAVSAFGTSGLTTGLTPDLHTLSKYVIIITMYIGRIGPLSAAVALAIRGGRSKRNYKYPEGKIVVG